MFKVGINSAPRITTPEINETEETQQQNVQEQIAPPQAKPVSAANSSIRSEAMFSTMAMRSQLTQQLANNESMKSNPESLQNIAQVDLKAPLTESQADQQINNKPEYDQRKPLTGRDPWNGALLPKTLFTGDGDDLVDIQQSSDGRVHVNVNGKEAWSGTVRQYQSLTINTGAGNDTVNIHNMNYLVGTKLQTGDGNDVVNNQSSLTSIDTGAGNDTVNSNGDNNQINTGDGNDIVEITGDNNEIQTGDGADWVRLNSERFTNGGIDTYSGYANRVDTGAGNDSVLVEGPVGAAISTGDGDDYVDNKGSGSTIQTGDGNDWVENSGDYSKIATGGGNDRINQTSGEGTTINPGEGYDHVFIKENHDGSDTGGYWMRDSYTGQDYWVRREENSVAPITVETDGNDVVYNSDDSKVIVDDEK